MHFIEKIFNPGKGYSAVFRQPGAASHCRLFHGYDLIFGVTLGAHTLDSNGWVFDFGGLKPVQKMLEDTFDHKMVVSETDEHLPLISELTSAGIADVTVLPQVGCEAFARWFYHRVEQRIVDLNEHGRVHVINTKVWEHAGNMAGFAPEGENPLGL